MNVFREKLDEYIENNPDYTFRVQGTGIKISRTKDGLHLSQVVSYTDLFESEIDMIKFKIDKMQEMLKVATNG